MTGFRAKLVLLLIVYFAGVATGIYLAMPGEARTKSRTHEEMGSSDFFTDTFKSNETAKAVRTGMDRCIVLGEQTSAQVAEAIRHYAARRDASAAADTPGG